VATLNDVVDEEAGKEDIENSLSAKRWMPKKRGPPQGNLQKFGLKKLFAPSRGISIT